MISAKQIKEFFEYANSKNTMFRAKPFKFKDYTLFSLHYMYMDVVEIESLPEIYREMRGLVVVKKGKEIIDTFLSIGVFFNLGQTRAVSLENLGSLKIADISDKLDGSLIVPYVIDGEVYFKTRRSFDHELLASIKNEIPYLSEVKNLVKELYDLGYDVIFEYTSPHNRIVVKYDLPALSIVQIRNRETLEYIDVRDVKNVLEKYEKIPVAKRYYPDMTLSEFVNKVDNDPMFGPYYPKYHARNFEGFVIRLENGKIIKFKTPWYFANHDNYNIYNALSKGDTRIIERLILEQKIDDLDYTIREEFKDLIESVNSEIMRKYHAFVDAAEKYVEIVKDREIKEFVNQIMTEFKSAAPLIFSAIRKAKRGEEIDYWKLFKENYKKVKNVF